MSLNQHQINTFLFAMNNYLFPSVYFDFINRSEITSPDMKAVEQYIGGLLRSSDPTDVKNGLANVLYWGYAQVGYRDKRVYRFLNLVNHKHITKLQDMISRLSVPNIVAIKNLRLPEFSGVSFVSKILMFLDPVNYCTLDQQIAKLRNDECTKALSRLTFCPKDTQIRISNHNQVVYNLWRNECRVISSQYFQNAYRVADVERGFFALIQAGNLPIAQKTYNDF